MPRPTMATLTRWFEYGAEKKFTVRLDATEREFDLSDAREAEEFLEEIGVQLTKKKINVSREYVPPKYENRPEKSLDRRKLRRELREKRRQAALTKMAEQNAAMARFNNGSPEKEPESPRESWSWFNPRPIELIKP